MGLDRASRLAESLLESNVDLDAFEVDVWSIDETKPVATALRRLGCRVEIDPFKPRLTVTRPIGT